MEVSRNEAIATALLAKFVGQQLNHVSELTTQQSRNIHNQTVDVNRILSELTIPPAPQPEGIVIPGASVDGIKHEVVLHRIENPQAIEPTTADIPNPFIQKQTTAVMSSSNNNISPMAQFLGKKPSAQIIHVEQPPEPQVPHLEQTRVELPSRSIDNILTSIFEKLMKIDLQITKIQKQLKKNNESKTVEE
jgi:hypothetical protein